LLSAGVTGAEGSFFDDMIEERSFDRVTTSSVWMAVFLRRGVFSEFDVISLCPDGICRAVIV
jgi:hypothetical protein